MTASELFEVLKPVMGRGALPVWLRFEPTGDYDGEAVWLTDTGYASPDAAVLIAEAAMVRWLIGEGWHRFTWEYNSDTDLVTLHLYGNKHTGKTHTAALVAACASVLEETK